MNPSQNSICIYYQNVRGLRTKTANLYTSSINCHFDIIVLTETWLNSSIYDSELFRSSDFMVHRCDRSSANSPFSNGGGVLIAVRANLHSERVLVPNSETLEILFVKCIIDKRVIHICCLYIPPAANENIFQAYIDTFEDYIDIIGTNTEESVYVIGDFNIPALKWCLDPDNSQIYLPLGAVKGVDLVHSLLSNGLGQLNSITNFQGTLLDLIFCNDVDDVKVIKSDVPLSKVDMYHYPIEIYVDNNQLDSIKNMTTMKLNFKFASFDNLNAYLVHGLIAKCSI